MKSEIIDIVKTRKLKLRYAKQIKSLFLILCLTKYKNLSIIFVPYNQAFKGRNLSFDIDWHYRSKDFDHKGISIILKLLVVEIQIEFADVRLLDD